MCLLCPFPIVKAISVRLQYFKDETKQSTCLGNQKSPLVCPFSGEQGLSSSSSPDLLFSPPPPCPCVLPPRGPVSVSVPVSVVGSHLAPPLSACLCVSAVLGRMVVLECPGWNRDRQGASRSLGPPQTLRVSLTWTRGWIPGVQKGLPVNRGPQTLKVGPGHRACTRAADRD